MATKDYYRILNVKTNASAQEIRRSYRKLAMKYHPDHNIEDILTESVFTEIAEAYKILSDEKSRNQYNQQRYFTAFQEYEKPAESFEELILKILRLEKQTLAADLYRFNRDALLYSIKQILPEDVNILLQQERGLLKQFLETLVSCCKRLLSAQTREIFRKMQPLYIQFTWLEIQLSDLIKQQQKKETLEKYKVLLAIVIAMILCMMIFFLANRQ